MARIEEEISVYRRDKQEPKMEWKNYIVGLVDISGQGSKLDELGSLWWELQDSSNVTKEKSERMKELKNETCGKVKDFRDIFFKSFNIFKELVLKNPKLTTLSPDEQTELKKIANDICTLRFFSDLAVFYIPFDAKNELSTCFNIAAMLYACTGASITKFKAGNFFRGGIEIGAGKELSDGEIYGPALNDAYKLEKNVAIYPRIVIGKKLTDFIQSEFRASDTGEYLNGVLARIDDFCKKMIYQDDDGEFTIDYLGKGIADLSRSSYNQTSDSVKKGIAKIETELNMHRKAGNQDLVKRFKKLLAYYQNRMKFWDNN